MQRLTSLVNLCKSVIKVGLLLTVAAMMVRPYLQAIEGSAMLAPGDRVVLFGAVLIRVMLGLLVGLALIAALDVAW